MKSKAQNATGKYDPSVLTKDLRYQWVAPSPPKPAEGIAYWTQVEDDPHTGLIEMLLQYEWKVAFIRQQITRLGLKPKGRTRAALTRQLVEGFLNLSRLTRQLNALNDEEQRFYKYWLLYTNLEALQTHPTPMEKLFPFPQTRATLTEKIIKAGLGIQHEDGLYFVPNDTFRLLPPTHITFPSEPEPESFVQAQPQILALKIQQWLSMLQAQKYQLRPRPQWQPPNIAYMGNYQVWPPIPRDAQRIIDNRNFQGAVVLCSPEPYPDADALDAWAKTLELAPETLEFIYHVMVSSQIVMPGSPVTLNKRLAQQWMMHPAGRQIVLVYELYRSIGLWADWWPQWRDGQIDVQWRHQNYWGLTSIERALTLTHYMLRWIILDVLAFLPHDVWLSLDKVTDLLGNLFPEPDTHIYQRGLIFQGTQQTWRGFLRLALESMLGGPLHQMGLVDVAPAPEHIASFCLRYLQDVHWGRFAELPTTQAEPLSAKTIEYQARTQTLQITPPAPPEFLSLVQRWAEPSGLADNRLQYRLDLGRLHAAFEHDETPETLAETWHASADFAPLPEIEAWWQHWWERYGHVRLYTRQATLVTQDDFTMHELQVALPSLRDAILGLVTPRVALLQRDQVDPILKDLERQGYMPKEEA